MLNTNKNIMKAVATMKATFIYLQRVAKTRSAKPVYNTSKAISSIVVIHPDEKPMKKITFTPSEKIALNLLKQGRLINTFDLIAEGLTPSKVISQLRSKGAIIKTHYKNTIDHTGKLRRRIAHYGFVDWE